MAKTKISEFDVDPSNNTDINSINIAEGCAPSGINNAIRQLMSDLKEFQTGASDDDFTVGGDLVVDGTSTFTGATTFTGAVVFSSTVNGSNLGNMANQSKNAVDITGGTVVGITDLAVADGGTGASSITANSVILGNGTSALSGNLVAPSTSGNVLTSNGTTWTSAAPATLVSAAGTVSNGGTFTFTTGSSGVALVTVQFVTTASYGNFGSSTGTLSISGSSVASQSVRTMEYDGRLSSATGVILYRHSGSANTTVTVTFNWSGSGSFNNASHMSLGI